MKKITLKETKKVTFPRSIVVEESIDPLCLIVYTHV